MAEVGAAKDWGFTPSAFRDLTEEDQAEMMAYTITLRMMQSWETQQAEHDAHRSTPTPSNKKKRKGG